MPRVAMVISTSSKSTVKGPSSSENQLPCSWFAEQRRGSNHIEGSACSCRTHHPRHGTRLPRIRPSTPRRCRSGRKHRRTTCKSGANPLEQSRRGPSLPRCTFAPRRRPHTHNCQLRNKQSTTARPKSLPDTKQFPRQLHRIGACPPPCSTRRRHTNPRKRQGGLPSIQGATRKKERSHHSKHKLFLAQP